MQKYCNFVSSYPILEISKPVACTINIYDRKFYDRKLCLSLERSYDRTIVILAKA